MAVGISPRTALAVIVSQIIVVGSRHSGARRVLGRLVILAFFGLVAVSLISEGSLARAVLNLSVGGSATKIGCFVGKLRSVVR